MTDVVNPKSASPDQLLPYHKKISAEGKALMKCFISYTYMVLKIPAICRVGKLAVLLCQPEHG
jgi:hypothetical protein